MRFPALLIPWLVATTATVVSAQQPEALFRSALSGDLPGVEQALADGIPIDSVDRYGSTALSLAASNGHLEVVALLLEKGADPDIAESFYYTLPVDAALFFGHTDVAELLISAGAAGRESALSFAANQGLTSLARTVVESGPIYQSDLAELQARSNLSPEMAAILADAKSRPDPEPPVYTVEELHAHTGVFEGWDSGTRVEVNLREGHLIAVLDDGSTHELVPTRESRFEAPGGDIELGFFGRAGLIEGFSLARQG
ncbi:MAG: ankyrin repeat domain-containing protein, partial [Acidobacteriota bacterium]